MKQTLLILALFLQSILAFAENITEKSSVADSLLIELRALPHDTTRLKLLEKLVLTEQNSPHYIEYAEEMFNEARVSQVILILWCHAEVHVVRLTDCLPQMIFLLYFLQMRGYFVGKERVLTRFVSLRCLLSVGRVNWMSKQEAGTILIFRIYPYSSAETFYN